MWRIFLKPLPHKEGKKRRRRRRRRRRTRVKGEKKRYLPLSMLLLL
jgi:hypothetical protein